MKIGLIDVDGHHYPNLALMKLSAYHKARGDTVEWWHEKEPLYDIVYKAKIFSDTYTKDKFAVSNAKKVICGGTGYHISVDCRGMEHFDGQNHHSLPPEIEHVYPDYALYPQFTGYGKTLKAQTAYGFLTRGCYRNCDFCIVSQKEGCCSHKVADIDEFWKHQGNIELLDPNILACKECMPLLAQLSRTRAKINFNQGLDARLITAEKARILAEMNLKQPHFAMDNINDMHQVESGIHRYVEAVKTRKGKWNWRNGKVFMIVNFNTSLADDIRRIKAIQACACQPYIMIYEKPTAPKIYWRLQRWCNSTFFYAKYRHDFMAFQKEHYKKVLPIE